ncbi:MAG: exosortase system-associated protein, TIGR04073 family [Myxococcota bacterium]
MSSRNRTPRILRTVALVAIAALLIPSVASAQSAARKLGRGLSGMCCMLLEIPGNMTKMTREDGATKGLTLGFAIGVGKMVPRALVGVYEFLTAPFPTPAGFKPILAPEYPWSYFDEPPPGA